MSEVRSSSRGGSVWLGLALVLLIAAALRLWRIETLPPGFHFDESFEGLEAWRILTDPAYRPIFLTGNFGVPPLNAYANAVTFWLVERLGGTAGPTAMRITAALFGVLGVAATYGMAAELRCFDRRRLTALFPLAAAAALAVMRWHIHFSRIGIEPILVPLIWAAATGFFLRGWRTGEWFSFAGSGMLLAAAMYAYQGAWIIPLLMLPVVGILWLEERRARRNRTNSDHKSARDGSRLSMVPLPAQRWRGILLTAAVAFLLVLPLGRFFFANPDLLLMRPAQVAVVGETASPADADIWTNVAATAKMFGPFGMPGDMDPRRNLPGAPALNLWLALPFYLGLAVAIWRIRNPAYSIPLVGLVGLLVPGVLTEYAPHFHRILGAAGPTAVLIGLGLNEIWRWGRSSRPWLTAWQQSSAGLAIALLLTLGTLTGARDYFVRWAGLPALFYAFDAGLWALGQTSAGLPTDEQVYITPRGSEHPTLAFAWRNRPDVSFPPVAFDGRHVFPVAAGVTTRSEHYAVVEHEDFRTRLLLPEVLPATTVTWSLPDYEGTTYARIYTRPAATEPARPPQHVLDAPVGGGMRLLGYDVQPAELHPGAVLYLQLHWLAEEQPAGAWTVFTHVVDPATGAVVAGQDGVPGRGSLPTPRWQPGWRILDEYQISLPVELPPGIYRLRTGLYQTDQHELPPGGLDLGTLEVLP